jgi:hypothetical protein
VIVSGDVRSSIVSSFTLIKGTMLDETYTVFERWDFGLSKRDNLDRLRQDNYIGASSGTWLRDVAKVINRRYDPTGRDRALVVLAKGRCPVDEWRPIALWHMTRDEFLLRDFLETWLYQAYEEGTYRVRPEDVATYLSGIRERGAVTEHAWTDATTDRVAAGLLRAAADFGLLTGTVHRQFAGYHLPERAFLYVMHALRDRGVTPRHVVPSSEWRMYLMRPAEVEREVLRLHQFRRLRYEAAGSVVELELPKASAVEYAEDMVA